MSADREPPQPRWGRELLGVLAALAIAVATVAAVAASARSALLFHDADSLVTTLVARSLEVGQPQDWAMSSVLFLPEIAAIVALSALGLGVAGTLAVAAVLAVVGLFGALRFAGGSATRAHAPIAGALLGTGAFALLAVTETSASRDALEPASLLLTTTYYGATVLATVLAIGIVRRGIEAPRRRWPLPVLAAVAAASVLTNPLFVAWATVPLVVVLAGVALLARRSSAWWLMTALVGGSAIGYLARMPLHRLIANTGVGYADPARWLESLGYYAALLGERVNAPWGPVALILGALLWCWCIVATVLLTRRGDVGAAVVAACGWVMPLLVVAGAIALGTHAARYLQPVAFAPVLGLVVLPSLVRLRRAVPFALAAGAAGVALVLAGTIGVPRIVAAATAPDADLACVVRWTDASGRTGAGQFWTVRLPKAHLADPRRLVQVDHELRGYAWLVNRDDFAVGEVSFLVIDGQSVPFALPGGVSLDDADQLVSCGRYTIADFGSGALPLGPQRS